MTNALAKGLTWRRLISRIADRRAARAKDRPVRSKPSGAPRYDQGAPNEGIGSPGVFLRTRSWPSDAILATQFPGYSALPQSSEITQDWPPHRRPGAGRERRPPVLRRSSWPSRS
jgi:hypothetical protein